MKRRRLALWLGAAVAALIGLCVTFAPYLFTELFIVFERDLHVSLMPPTQNAASFRPRPGAPLGEVIDGYWRVQQIAPDTWAIGEPQDAPDNYEYLLVGQSRALLIDAGATRRDIHQALSRLTKLPVTVIPSHLHFDHTNGLSHFTSIALIDTPQTRAREKDGVVRLGRYQYIGSDGPVFRPTQWVKPDEWIDLGGRRVQVLLTPGHTATSVSIHDPERKLLFTGDLIYPTSLYVFLPDSSLSAYRTTAARLLAAMPADTTIYGAHCCRNDGPPQAPWLSMSDLRDVDTAVAAIQAGQAKGRGVFIRRFPVNGRMTLLTLYPLANH
ncbi:MBL fold metallo-hydrolase [Phenylobacterium sp.]|uniref:MBL fold metallo-hydrolase n=1 Tax=Phenylobacterium sp. TaxID=1871053 RepID=UPI0035B0DC36